MGLEKVFMLLQIIRSSEMLDEETCCDVLHLHLIHYFLMLGMSAVCVWRYHFFHKATGVLPHG